MKVCFVTNSVYRFFFSCAGYQSVGGAEYQQKMIGLALIHKGFDVSFISYDLGQPDFHEQDGLTFIKSFRPDAGLPGIRFFHPRLTKLWRALINADADVYYLRPAGFLTGVLAVFCWIYGKKFIFAAGSDLDFIPERVKATIHFARDRQLYHFGLRRASAILVQSDHQKNLLWDNHRLRGIVIRNYYEMPGIIKGEREYVLWVANIKNLKQPMKFVDLAARFPHELFVMIGGPDDPGLFEQVSERCARIPNLKFLGFRPVEETESYFDRCKVFVNTSEYEGFPNTFLQSWSRGVPVVSSVDPDGVIGRNGLGIVAESDAARDAALKKCLAGDAFDPQRIRDYVNENHCSGVISQLCSLLESLHEGNDKKSIT